MTSSVAIVCRIPSLLCDSESPFNASIFKGTPNKTKPPPALPGYSSPIVLVPTSHRLEHLKPLPTQMPPSFHRRNNANVNHLSIVAVG
mmetsp:Transcript_13922/g.21040  ORF Transcript_13922/g.21040 Transcript_13922/m.21040 type:complete len:88 (-) Transcript_13922:633-896(-)